MLTQITENFLPTYKAPRLEGTADENKKKENNNGEIAIKLYFH
jgi:hypothetical protein